MNPLRAAASVNGWFRKRSLGKIRLNWVVFVVLGICLVACLCGAYDSLGDDREPRPIPLADLLAGKAMTNHHVEVTGLVFPKTNLRYPPARHGIQPPVQYTYVAMTEDDPTRVFLVRFPGDLASGAPRHATITGLLTAPDVTLLRHLEAHNGKIAGLPIDPRYVLLAGVEPVPRWLFPGLAAIFALILSSLSVAEFVSLRSRSSLSPERGN